ncbi:MAG TPA: hypothetical protein VE967_09430 [Gemmatimonadaceae bacterium]|nr:hypothetical protein [Gemmatimonadaceae bacterium]
MTSRDSNAAQAHVGYVEYDGRKYAASCRVSWDGLEYIGRMWFTNEGDKSDRLTDRGALPGRTVEEVTALAQRLTADDLQRRIGRAHAEKRRYVELRGVTDQIIAKIRYMNQVALSIRAGVLDREGGMGEIELTERQLHELIDSLKESAGLEA